MAKSALSKFHNSFQLLAGELAKLSEEFNNIQGGIAPEKLKEAIRMVIEFKSTYFRYISTENERVQVAADKKHTLEIDFLMAKVQQDVAAITKVLTEYLPDIDAGEQYQAEARLEKYLLTRRASENIRELQILTEHIVNTLGSLESKLLDRAQSYAETHFQAILRKHNRHMEWIDFLIKIYEDSTKSVQDEIEKIEKQLEKNKELGKDVAIILVGLATGPFGVETYIEPAMKLIQAAKEGVQLLLDDDDFLAEKIRSCQSDFLDEKLVSKKGAMRTSEVDPIQVLQVIKRYGQYKIKGVLELAHQLFNTKLATHTLTDDINPKDLIRDFINMKVIKTKRLLSEGDWHILSKSEFKKFLDKLTAEAEKELLKLIDEVFSVIDNQYKQVNEFIPLVSIIDKVCFDDSVAGVHAVNNSFRQLLEKELRHIVEASMLMEHARETQSFFREQPSKKSKAVFKKEDHGLFPSFTSKKFLKIILRHHCFTTGEEYESKKKLLTEREPGKYVAHCLGHQPFATQRNRQQELLALQNYYAPESLEAKLKEAMFTFAKKHQIDVEPLPTENRMDSGGHWRDEKSLFQDCRRVVANLVDFSRRKKERQAQEIELLRNISYWKKGEKYLLQRYAKTTEESLQQSAKRKRENNRDVVIKQKPENKGSKKFSFFKKN